MPNQPPERLTGVQPTHALATSVLAARRSRVLTVPRERVPVAGTHRAPEPLNPMIESILECWCRLQVNRRPEMGSSPSESTIYIITKQIAVKIVTTIIVTGSRFALIESGDAEFLVSAAEGISARLAKSPGVFLGWLQDTIGALEPKHPEILKSIATLPCVLATLNYDGLFEKTTEDSVCPDQPLYRNKFT
jgi:hypothetical protein